MLVYICCAGGATSSLFCKKIGDASKVPTTVEDIFTVLKNCDEYDNKYEIILAYGPAEFFSHFAADSLFQSRRVQEPLAFVTSDPDDDFSILETSLDLNQWFAFKPALPTDRLSNINYGQRNDDNSPTKILALKGIGNGFSNILYFRRKAGEWQLYKFEDTSI